MTTNSLAQMSDPELLQSAVRAAAEERRTTVDLLILIGEIDSRRAYLSEGCSSLFSYCTRILRLSEHEAYHRIEAARAARQFPQIVDRLRDGALTLTAVTLLRPHLTPDNADALVAAALSKSRREVEQQMARLAPKPEVKTILRRLPLSQPLAASEPSSGPAPLPALSTAVSPESPTPRAISTPLASDRFLLRVTLSAEAHAKLRRAQDLLRHTLPGGDPAAIIDRALAVLVDDLERRRIARVNRPRRNKVASSPMTSSTRYIPAAVRREVWARDRGRCAFVGRSGRCQETGRLEFHHLKAFALGGSTSTENLELRCRAHNQFESTLLFGAREM